MEEETATLVNELFTKMVEKVKEEVLSQLKSEEGLSVEEPVESEEEVVEESEEQVVEESEEEVVEESEEQVVEESEVEVVEESEEEVVEESEEEPTEEPTEEPGSDYKYAKRQKPVQGSKKLCVIGLKWKNTRKSAKISDCKSVGKEIETFYKKNSKGLLNFQVSTHVVSVPYTASNKNLNKAENFSKNKYKGFEYYAILSNLNAIIGKENSNAGKDTAHLRGNSARTACHEMGHLLGLGHAGAYKNGKLDHYGDSYSVMSSMPSGFLTAPQYYKLGWFGNKGVAMYEPGKIYKLKKLTNFDGKDGLSGVMIPTPGKRDAWVSVVKPKGKKGGDLAICLHLSSGGSSQKVKMFGNKFTDSRFTGLTVEKLSQKDGIVELTITESPKVVKRSIKVESGDDIVDTIGDITHDDCDILCECPDDECICSESESESEE